MHILQCVAALGLPDCYVAAGFVRNMVWDYLHDYDPTLLNDVDVIYFSPQKISQQNNKLLEARLMSLIPDVRWQIKNQALMHHLNSDHPYRSSLDAMTFWPEKETAIGVRLEKTGEITIAAPFGVESLFGGCITHNPARERPIFEQRVQSKQWLKIWPRLRLIY